MNDKEYLFKAEQRMVYAQVKSWGRTFNLESRAKVMENCRINKELAALTSAKDILEVC